METIKIDCESIAKSIRENVVVKISRLKRDPKILFVKFDDSVPTQRYFANISKDAHSYHIKTASIEFSLSDGDAPYDAIKTIREIMKSGDFCGFIIQQPAPKLFYEAIKNDTLKDYDLEGTCSFANTGILWSGDKSTINTFCAVPCTAEACEIILKNSNVDLTGKHAVIVNRSNVVGKPLAALLLNMDMTVTICHSKTKNLSDITRMADVLISAVGIPNFITGDNVKPDAIVIDVGTSYMDGKVHGDLDITSIEGIASQYASVPRGVGLVTRACLLHNICKLELWHETSYPH